MSDETLVEKPGGRMTRDDLVRRRDRSVYRESDGWTMICAICGKSLSNVLRAWDDALLCEACAEPSVPVSAVEGMTVAGARAFWRWRDEAVAHERLRADVMTIYSDPHLTWEQARVKLAHALAAPPQEPPRVPDTPQGWPDANNAVRWESRKPQCVIGVYCQRHGFIHGQEAEELREHLEALSLPAVNRVLDEVDARDSLAYLEATNEPTPPDVAPPQEPPR